MKRNTIDIITLGCSKNLVDSEKLMRQLEANGYKVTHDSDKPQGLDTGNCDSLLEASNFVATIQNRQGFRVSCIEEIAWRKGWIDVDQLYRLGEQLGKTEYGKYLMELAESKR